MIVARMRKELESWRVLPAMPKVGEETEIVVTPLGAHAAFEEGAAYRVYLVGMEQNAEPKPTIESHPCVTVVARGGGLRFSWTFPMEQEYRLIAFLEGGEKRVCELRLYALEADLHALTPYRGDLHVHSYHSDGKEAPAIVAANYRKAGFDFMGITDHRQYAPSLEAIAAYEGAPIDLRILPGEEVHAPDNHIHIVNFGGDVSLNDIFRDDPDGYDEQVSAMEDAFVLPEGVDRREAAASFWAFNTIRRSGGLAIYPHPHWNYSVYHVPDAMSRFLFKRHDFDAFELLGGQDAFSNNMQTAFWGEMRSRGLEMPVVGSSDSHGTVDAEWFGWAFTIAFASDNSWPSLREGIRAGRSVAVEAYPGEQPRFYGPYRYVKPAMYLWDTYFILHGELCFEEGRLMKEYALGDPRAAEILAMLRGRTAALARAWYGREDLP